MSVYRWMAITLTVVVLVLGAVTLVEGPKPTPVYQVGDVVTAALTEEKVMVLETRCYRGQKSCSYWVRDRWLKRVSMQEHELVR